MESPVKFLKMQDDDSFWTEATGDGVIYGCGTLDTNWLNTRHNHNEGTPQKAFITHWPKEYVEFYHGNPKEMKNVGENIGKAIDPIMDRAKDLIKELDEEKKRQEEERKKKEEEKGAKTQAQVKKNSTGNGQVHASFIDGGLITGPVIVACIGIAWELLKMAFTAIGDKAKEDALQYYNSDGSITFIVADYYSGTAARMHHVGFFGWFNNVDRVAQMSERIKKVSASNAKAYGIFSKSKNFKSRITLKAAKAPAKKTPVKQAPTKQAPTKQTPAKQTPTKQAPAKQAPVKKAPAKSPAKAPAAKKPR